MAVSVINVSNRLPVTVRPDRVVRSSGGLVAALEGLPRDQYDLTWLGWPGEEIESAQRQREVEHLLRSEHGCIPVFLTGEQAEAHYEGFSNAGLWPLLHYFLEKFRYEPAWWDHYRDVNQLFADKVLSIADDEDLIWVHDYQLMLVPQMLRQARPELRIGFFLHTPFPSYEVFRCHPKRNELIAGLLGADLIGFHSFGYLRHFRSAALRLLGLESEITRIVHEGRATTLGVHPIGINAKGFEQALERPDVAARRAALAAGLAGKQMILSVERLDYTKGILHRLEAIDQFLADAEKAGELATIKFVFVTVPSREGVEEYRELREEIETQIGRINGEYATLNESPIQFLHASVPFTDLVALYTLARLALVTPLIDGMNLVAKEYVACQRPDEDSGVLVLSEFAGAAEELFDALSVNPYDPGGVADAMRRGLQMHPEERRRRMARMRQRVLQFDAASWARRFIEDLQAVNAGPAAARAARAAAVGKGQSVDDIARRISQAIVDGKRVGLFLDYDGTLREIVADPAAAAPNEAVRRTFDVLARVPHNVDVTVISGRVPRDLEVFLGDYPFGLIAEHGAALRRPDSRQWERLDQNATYAWKGPLLKVLELYEQTTPGSFIEEKRTSLVWHYRRADPEFGRWKAKQLLGELSTLASNEPVQVRQGKKIIEVAATQVSKGVAVQRIAEEKGYDLIFCAGDDTTDQSMYRLTLPNLLSLHVGRPDDPGAAAATAYLPDPAALRDFLDHAIPATTAV